MYTYIPISPPSCVSLPPSLSHPSRWRELTFKKPVHRATPSETSRKSNSLKSALIISEGNPLTNPKVASEDIPQWLSLRTRTLVPISTSGCDLHAVHPAHQLCHDRDGEYTRPCGPYTAASALPQLVRAAVHMRDAPWAPGSGDQVRLHLWDPWIISYTKPHLQDW